MFKIYTRNKDQNVASGCGGCAVKNEGNCTNHLAAAATLVVQGFVEAQIMFDRSNPEHVEVIAGILAEDIRDDQNRPVALEVPKEPRLQDWFYGMISHRVACALKAKDVHG